MSRETLNIGIGDAVIEVKKEGSRVVFHVGNKGIQILFECSTDRTLSFQDAFSAGSLLLSFCEQEHKRTRGEIEEVFKEYGISLEVLEALLRPGDAYQNYDNKDYDTRWG